MEFAFLGIVFDSSAVIAAERKNLLVSEFIEAISYAYGPLDVSLSTVTVAELVHGIYRAKTVDAGRRRRQYIEELIRLIPVPSRYQQDCLVDR